MEDMCKCMSWVRFGNDTLFSIHHNQCPRRDIENEAKKHLLNLLEALEYEANMGDGINELYLELYKDAKFFTTGKIVEEKECL